MQRISQSFDFTGHTGEKLSGRLELPSARKPSAFAVFAHCFTCSKDVHAAARVSRALAERGIGVLRFDFTGLGDSEGCFADTTFSSNLEDVKLAANALAAQYRAPAIFIGHSLGGAAMLAAVKDIPGAALVATLAAPSDPAHVTHHLEKWRDRIESEGMAEVDIGGQRFSVKKAFLDDISGHSLETALSVWNGAAIFFHDPADDIVDFSHAERLFALTQGRKALVSLPGAGHMFGARADADMIADTVVAWARQSGLLQDDAGHDLPETGHGTAYVTESGEGKFTLAINAEGHALLADEPKDLGGDDRGPAPYGLLLAALGACTVMTLRMYAEHKSLPVEKISVALSHKKQKDAQAQGDGQAQDIFTRVLHIEGAVSEVQKQRMAEIAEKCPVHRTLMATPVIHTRLSGTDFETDDDRIG